MPFSRDQSWSHPGGRVAETPPGLFHDFHWVSTGLFNDVQPGCVGDQSQASGFARLAFARHRQRQPPRRRRDCLCHPAIGPTETLPRRGIDGRAELRSTLTEGVQDAIW